MLYEKLGNWPAKVNPKISVNPTPGHPGIPRWQFSINFGARVASELYLDLKILEKSTFEDPKTQKRKWNHKERLDSDIIFFICVFGTFRNWTFFVCRSSMRDYAATCSPFPHNPSSNSWGGSWRQIVPWQKNNRNNITRWKKNLRVGGMRRQPLQFIPADPCQAKVLERQ